MAKNPYADSENIAELLWETEMVADKYSNGGLILIRTQDGWRAFLGALKDDVLQEMEKSLDKNVPSYEQAFGEISRSPNLIEEFHRLLPNCMCFPGYRPMKFIDDLGEDE
jgi:hypothetical protein